jgi:putative two-component system response regulator
MSLSCELLARSIGLSPRQAELIRFASPMHDVGKIGIPDSILLKPGKLDAAERKIMCRHAQIGAEIVGDHDDEILSIAKIMALYHHEKWDGSGYPYGLKGEEIPLEARIVAICDVFDALTSTRPYKTAWSIDDAANFLKTHAGSHFDPSLVPVFLTILPDIIAFRNRLPD